MWGYGTKEQKFMVLGNFGNLGEYLFGLHGVESYPCMVECDFFLGMKMELGDFLIG
jgi:hypothetical protein